VGLGAWGHGARFTLDPATGDLHRTLFQGLADGKPDVAEEELLKAAETATISELFPVGEGNTLEENLGSVVRSGAQPKTWRLNVPDGAKPVP